MLLVCILAQPRERVEQIVGERMYEKHGRGKAKAQLYVYVCVVLRVELTQKKKVQPRRLLNTHTRLTVLTATSILDERHASLLLYVVTLATRRATSN